MDSSRSQNPPSTSLPGLTTVPAERPTLRLRFDPPPDPGPQEFEQVLSEVDQLSHGIDAMLRHASDSAIGAQAPAAADDDDDDEDIEGDDPMLVMFDEEDSSDIHAIDRMIAREADGLLASERQQQPIIDRREQAIAVESLATPQTAGAIHLAPTDDKEETQSEVVLEGEFDSIETLLGLAVPSVRTMPGTPATTPMLATPDITPSDAASLGLGEPASDASFTAALEHTQAANLAATAIQPSSPVVEVTSHLPVVQAAAPTEAVGILPDRAIPMSPVVDHKTPATMVEAKVIGNRRSPLALVAQAIAFTNLPLRLLPSTARPAINLLALTLAMWAPVVWTLGPKLAARSAAAATMEAGTPEHGESGIRDDDAAHGGTSADSHGDAKADAAKKSSASSKSKTSSKKTSSAKKSSSAGDAAHH